MGNVLFVIKIFFDRTVTSSGASGKAGVEREVPDFVARFPISGTSQSRMEISQYLLDFGLRSIEVTVKVDAAGYMTVRKASSFPDFTQLRLLL